MSVCDVTDATAQSATSRTPAQGRVRALLPRSGRVVVWKNGTEATFAIFGAGKRLKLESNQQEKSSAIASPRA
jgi:hypothetical protein